MRGASDLASFFVQTAEVGGPWVKEEVVGEATLAPGGFVPVTIDRAGRACETPLV
jgi:hypothetical protein